MASTKRRASDGPKGAGSFAAGMQFGRGIWKFTGAASPTNGASGTGAGWADAGSEYTDTAGKKLYVNTGTKASPTWTVAGTVYDAIGSAAPVAGATITVVDADGTELELVTARNGNFYSSRPVRFPLQVSGSRCPDTIDTIDMIAKVASTGASCNRGGCHDAGNRIYLP